MPASGFPSRRAAGFNPAGTLPLEPPKSLSTSVAPGGSYRRVMPASLLFRPPICCAEAGLKKTPLPALEAALVVVTALHLSFLPWALGAMHVWSQLASLGLALVGFVLAVIPRTGAGNFATTSATPAPVSRLGRFPVFWAGLALLGYVGAQGFNPSWRYVSNAGSWWLEPVTHLSWLPSGVDAPFEQSNPWRALVIYGSLWLLVCSVWTGFIRRRSYRMLFTLLTGNAFLLVLLGGLQQLSAAKKIFWVYLPSNPAFSASFIYPNHAGAYFNLMVALSTGLTLWHWRRVLHGLEGPGPLQVFALFAACLGLMVLFTYSRMSILLLLGFVALLGCILTVRSFQRNGAAPDRTAWLHLTVVLAGLLGFCLVSIQSEKVWTRFSHLQDDLATEREARSQVRQASVEMLRDRWFYGWGAGCFRYGFPLYAQKYPYIYNPAGGTHRLWEHAHDDLLEIPIEVGVAGLLPIAGLFGYAVWQLGRHRFWRNAVSLCLVAGCSFMLVHAWVDFVFQNPAVFFTWAVLFIGALRWAELDAPVRPPR